MLSTPLLMPHDAATAEPSQISPSRQVSSFSLPSSSSLVDYLSLARRPPPSCSALPPPNLTLWSRHRCQTACTSRFSHHRRCLHYPLQPKVVWVYIRARSDSIRYQFQIHPASNWIQIRLRSDPTWQRRPEPSRAEANTSVQKLSSAQLDSTRAVAQTRADPSRIDISWLRDLVWLSLTQPSWFRRNFGPDSSPIHCVFEAILFQTM